MRLRRVIFARCASDMLPAATLRKKIVPIFDFIGIKQTDKSEFEGFKQVSPKQILGAIKTIAFPWREGGPLAVDEWTP